MAKARAPKPAEDQPLTKDQAWAHLLQSARFFRRGASPTEAIIWAEIEIELAARLESPTGTEAPGQDVQG